MPIDKKTEELHSQANLESVQQLNPDLDAKQYWELGNTQAEQSQWDEAKSCYLKAIQIQPDYVEAYLHLGDIFKKQNQLDEAIHYYLEAANLKRNFFLPYRRLDALLKTTKITQDQIEKISEVAVKALQKYPDKKQTQTLRLSSLIKLGKKSEIIKFCQDLTYRKNLDAKPEFANQFWEPEKLGFPNFMIIGFMKCGTTSLYDYMTQHPNILLGRKKEIHFFDNPDFDKLGLDCYGANFPPIPENSLYWVGEATTEYIRHSNIAQKIRENFPNLKIIVLVRNPVSRTISHFHFSRKMRGVKHSLETAIQSQIQEIENMTDLNQELDHKNGFVSLSLYAYYLEKWMSVFPRENFLVLSLENLSKNSQSTLDKVFEFQKLPSHIIDFDKNYNKGNYLHSNDEISRLLYDFFKPHNQRLENLVEQKFDWD